MTMMAISSTRDPSAFCTTSSVTASTRRFSSVRGSTDIDQDAAKFVEAGRRAGRDERRGVIFLDDEWTATGGGQLRAGHYSCGLEAELPAEVGGAGGATLAPQVMGGNARGGPSFAFDTRHQPHVDDLNRLVLGAMAVRPLVLAAEVFDEGR